MGVSPGSEDVPLSNMAGMRETLDEIAVRLTTPSNLSVNIVLKTQAAYWYVCMCE